MTTPRSHAELAARQSVTDELRLAAKSAAPYGTAMIGVSHLSDAADTIDTLRADLDRAIVNFGDAAATVCDMRAQLAEAQKDAERLDWIIEHRAYVVSDPDCCDGYWLNYARPDGTMWTQATEHETPRAAIDAAKGESNG